MKSYASGLLAAALAVSVIGCGRGPSLEEVQSAIRAEIEADSTTRVRALYERRQYEPAFVHADRSSDRLETALQLFCQSAAHGLAPRDYLTDALRERVEAVYGDETEADEARQLARLDVAVSRALLRYTSDVLTGRVDPTEVASTWKTPVHRIDPAVVVAAALEDGTLDDIPQQVGAMHGQYGELQRTLVRYRKLALRGGWPTIPEGEPLEKGDSGERVRVLIERLASEGDLDSTLLSDSTYRFTADVEEAVRIAQRRFGLDVDGIAGERLIGALNVPLDDRIQQIEINMERWRWIPGHFGSRYLYVNIPAFELHAFEEGREVLSMAVVVGEQYADNATPVFSDTMEYVVFNPYWNVPESIAREEIVPEARADRSYLVQNDYEVVSGWSAGAGVLNPLTADLDRVEEGRYRIRQKPGPKNALGRIKFMFPNEFDIYLHDTPADYLFERAERAYSHGCIRVERPLELAEFVFANGEWSEDRVRDAIEGGREQTVSLARPLPVYILYWTAFVDKTGRPNFRADLYGNDAELSAALRARSSEQGVPCDAFRALITS